jgi:hypothetical protein
MKHEKMIKTRKNKIHYKTWYGRREKILKGQCVLDLTNYFWNKIMGNPTM